MEETKRSKEDLANIVTSQLHDTSASPWFQKVLEATTSYFEAIFPLCEGK